MINGTCAVVEHGLLDEPLSQRLDEKIYITLRGSGRNSDMMKSRSEEHTSELQSLMRISYAVFCLKTKITMLMLDASSLAYTSHDTLTPLAISTLNLQKKSSRTTTHNTTSHD